jgi:hypothetical protein
LQELWETMFSTSREIVSLIPDDGIRYIFRKVLFEIPWWSTVSKRTDTFIDYRVSDKVSDPWTWPGDLYILVSFKFALIPRRLYKRFRAQMLCTADICVSISFCRIVWTHSDNSSHFGARLYFKSAVRGVINRPTHSD